MYPVTYSAAIPIEGRHRPSTWFRTWFAQGANFAAGLYIFAAYFAAIVAWFSIVFTGRYPERPYAFVARAVRFYGYANSYFWLAVDESPPMPGDKDARFASYPVQVGTPPPLAKYSRLKTGLRGIFGIPVYLLLIVWSIILLVVTVIAWFAIIFTRRVPEGLVKPIHDALAYTTRASAYFLLLTEDWPPFSEDAGAPTG